MKEKTARRWLARNKWRLAKAKGDGPRWNRKLRAHYYLCLAITNPLFKRF